MKLFNRVVLSSLLVCSVEAMANDVSITNTSVPSIAVQYQIAYHDTGHPLELEGVQQSNIESNGSLSIPLFLGAHERVGVVVRAVKKDAVGQAWHTFPTTVELFELKQGCWISTNKNHPSGAIFITYTEEDPEGEHGQIKCSVGRV